MPAYIKEGGVINLQGYIVAEKIIYADTFFKRLRGLLGRRSLSPGEGLLLAPCNAVHSLFMRFTFDAVFLDKDDRVVKVIPNMRPFRFSPVVRRATSVLELPAGTAWGIKEGDKINLERS